MEPFTKSSPRKRNEEARAHRIPVTCYLMHSFHKKHASAFSIIVHIVYYLIRPESRITSSRCRLVRLSDSVGDATTSITILAKRGKIPIRGKISVACSWKHKYARTATRRHFFFVSERGRAFRASCMASEMFVAS